MEHRTVEGGAVEDADRATEPLVDVVQGVQDDDTVSGANQGE